MFLFFYPLYFCHLMCSLNKFLSHTPSIVNSSLSFTQSCGRSSVLHVQWQPWGNISNRVLFILSSSSTPIQIFHRMLIYSCLLFIYSFVLVLLQLGQYIILSQYKSCASRYLGYPHLINDAETHSFKLFKLIFFASWQMWCNTTPMVN